MFSARHNRCSDPSNGSEYRRGTQSFRSLVRPGVSSCQGRTCFYPPRCRPPTWASQPICRAWRRGRVLGRSPASSVRSHGRYRNDLLRERHLHSLRPKASLFMLFKLRNSVATPVTPWMLTLAQRRPQGPRPAPACTSLRKNFRFCDSYHSAANLRTFGSSAPIHPASKQPWSPPIRPGLFHWARLAAVLSPCALPHQIEAPLTLKWGRSE